VDIVSIFSPNALHTDYSEDAIYHKKHILCEKPLCVVTDIDGKASGRDLDTLIRLNEERESKGLIFMDAEHYSSKSASKIFFDNIGEIVGRYGKITEVRGYLEEKDNPDKSRTRKLLCRQNQTGLLLDTGVHLLSMITGIGGELRGIENAVYGMHPDYNVETKADVDLNASGEFFEGNVPVHLKIGKFINLYEEPRDGEKKQIEFDFEKDGVTNTLVVDFKTGEVRYSNGEELVENPIYEYSNIEYVNVLNELYDCINNQREPRTSATNSIKILDAIHRCYRDFPVSIMECSNILLIQSQK